jgi:hypothetical protein
MPARFDQLKKRTSEARVSSDKALSTSGDLLAIGETLSSRSVSLLVHSKIVLASARASLAPAPAPSKDRPAVSELLPPKRTR